MRRYPAHPPLQVKSLLGLTIPPDHKSHLHLGVIDSWVDVFTHITTCRSILASHWSRAPILASDWSTASILASDWSTASILTFDWLQVAGRCAGPLLLRRAPLTQGEQSEQ